MVAAVESFVVTGLSEAASCILNKTTWRDDFQNTLNTESSDDDDEEEDYDRHDGEGLVARTIKKNLQMEWASRYRTQSFEQFDGNRE